MNYVTLKNLYKGLGLIKDTKVATLLFSHLNKYGILIRKRITDFDWLKKHEYLQESFNFFITDCCIRTDVEVWEKYIHRLPEIRFILIHGSILQKQLLSLQKLKFLLIDINNFSISILANQILNVLKYITPAKIWGVNNEALKLSDSDFDEIRVLLPKGEYFIFTKISKVGFLQYKHYNLKFSTLETTIFYELATAYKWAAGALVRFPLLNYKQITNTVSRIRKKLLAINFPLVLKNDYSRGYYLTFKGKKV